MISSVLVAVDGSRAARKAIALASEIVKAANGTVHLVHVVKEPQLPEALQDFIDAEQLAGPPEKVLHQIASHVLDDAVRRAKESGAPNVTTEIMTGPVARTIVAYAKDRKVDMIAIGTRGGNDFDELLLGGVSRRVSALAPCSCLLVK